MLNICIKSGTYLIYFCSILEFFSLSVFWTSNANKAKLQGQFQSTLEIASHFPSPPLLTGSKLNLDTCICSIHPHKIVQSNLKYAETAVIDQFEHFICCFRQNGEYCLNFSNGSFLSFSFLFFVKINNKILKKQTNSTKSVENDNARYKMRQRVKYATF